MPGHARHRTVRPAPSERAAHYGMLVLAVGVPLVYQTDLFSLTLLPRLFLVQAILLGVSLVWVLDVRAGRAPAGFHTRLALPAFLYLFAAVLAFTRAGNPVAALVSLSHQLTFVLLFLVVAGTFSIASLPAFLRAAAAAGLLVSLLGVLEARGVPMGWIPSAGRPSATFGYRNFAAVYLIADLPLAVALYLRARTWKDLCLGAASAALMLVFLVYTRTRGAWVGLAGAALFTALLVGHARYRWRTAFSLPDFLRTRPALAVAGSALVLALGLALLPVRVASPQSQAIDPHKLALTDALSSVTAPGADRGRLALWSHTLRMVADHPLLGVGPGNWQFAYPPYDGGDMLRPGSEPRRPHNDFLWIWSELGTLGLAAYLYLLGAAAFALFRILRRPGRPGDALYAVAFGALLLSILGDGCFSFPRELVEPSFLFWTGLGVLARLDAGAPTGPRRVRLARSALIGIPVLLVLSLWVTVRHIRFDAHYLLAREYYSGGDFRSVLRESRAALSAGPFDPQAFLLESKGHQAAGMLPQAVADCVEGLRYHPHSPRLLGDLGACYARMDSLDRAERCFRAVLALSPYYYQMYNNLGGVYQKRGDLPSAIEAYRQALKREPGYLDAYSNLALAYLDAGRPEEAIRTCRQALARAPQEAVFYYTMGEAYDREAGQDPARLRRALRAYETFLETWKGPREYADRARSRIAEIRARLAGRTP